MLRTGYNSLTKTPSYDGYLTGKWYGPHQPNICGAVCHGPQAEASPVFPRFPPQLSPCCWGSLLHCLPLHLFAVWTSSWTHHFLPLDWSQLVWAGFCNVLLNPGGQQWCPSDNDLTESSSIQALDPLPRTFKLCTDSSVCIQPVTTYACRHVDRYSYCAHCDMCYET